MATVETASRRPTPRRQTVKRRPAREPSQSGASLVAPIRELAWIGQHAQAIEESTRTLASRADRAGLPGAVQMDLLDLRAESNIALGQLDHAAQDAAAMVQLATRHKSPASKVQALNRKALIQMRQGELKAAIDSAVAAAKIARQSRRKPLLATSLLSLGEVQVRAGQYEVALKIAQQAVELFEAAGESSSAGRAHWVSAMACQRLGRNKQSRAAAQSALELCTQAADRYGIGNALVLLSQSDPDIAASVRHLRQATQALEAAGYVERRMVAVGNLATKYDELVQSRHLRTRWPMGPRRT